MQCENDVTVIKSKLRLKAISSVNELGWLPSIRVL